MKYLIWKLTYKNEIYTVQYRKWFVISYLLIFSPLIVVFYLFKKFYDWFWAPFDVPEKMIESHITSKKFKKEIFKILISKP